MIDILTGSSGTLTSSSIASHTTPNVSVKTISDLLSTTIISTLPAATSTPSVNSNSSGLKFRSTPLAHATLKSVFDFSLSSARAMPLPTIFVVFPSLSSKSHNHSLSLTHSALSEVSANATVAMSSSDSQLSAVFTLATQSTSSSTLSQSLPSISSHNRSPKTSLTTILVLGVIGATCLVTVFGVLCFWLYERFRKRDQFPDGLSPFNIHEHGALYDAPTHGHQRGRSIYPLSRIYSGQSTNDSHFMVSSHTPSHRESHSEDRSTTLCSSGPGSQHNYVVGRSASSISNISRATLDNTQGCTLGYPMNVHFSVTDPCTPSQSPPPVEPQHACGAANGSPMQVELTPQVKTRPKSPSLEILRVRFPSFLTSDLSTSSPMRQGSLTKSLSHVPTPMPRESLLKFPPSAFGLVRPREASNYDNSVDEFGSWAGSLRSTLYNAVQAVQLESLTKGRGNRRIAAGSKAGGVGSNQSTASSYSMTSKSSGDHYQSVPHSLPIAPKHLTPVP
ncbi:hypothetical protein BU17DRAFT_86675 [Hysterangium stoloniferum]|nr:hypothetical protein BU17DRAFT_86675 [Hysterangium stoloniferum]